MIPLPTAAFYGRPTQSRLKSTHEIQTMTARSNYVKVSSCKVCLEVGHNVSGCPTARKYGGYVCNRGDKLYELQKKISNLKSNDDRKLPSTKPLSIPNGTYLLVIEDLKDCGVVCTCFKIGGHVLSNDWIKRVFDPDVVGKWLYDNKKRLSKV